MAAEVTIRLDVDSSAAMQKIQNLVGQINKIGSTGAGKATGEAAANINKMGNAAASTTSKVSTLGKASTTAGQAVRQGAEATRAAAAEKQELIEKIQTEINRLGDYYDGMIRGQATLEGNTRATRDFASSIQNETRQAVVGITKMMIDGRITADDLGESITDLRHVYELLGLDIDDLTKEIKEEEIAKKSLEKFNQQLKASEIELARAVKTGAKEAATAAKARANLIKRRQSELAGQGKQDSNEYKELVKARNNAEIAAERHAEAMRAESAELRVQKKQLTAIRSAEHLVSKAKKGTIERTTAAAKQLELLKKTQRELIASGKNSGLVWDEMTASLSRLGHEINTELSPDAIIMIKRMEDLEASFESASQAVVKAQKALRAAPKSEKAAAQEDLAVAELQFKAVSQEVRTLHDQEIPRLENKLIQLGPAGEQSVQQISRALLRLNKGMKLSQQNVAKLGRIQSHASVSLLDMSRIAEDAAYGFRGMANNIVPAIQSFNRLKQTAGGMKDAMKGLVAGLIGPGGLFIAVGLLSTIILKSGDAWKKLFFSEKDVERMKRLKDAFKEAEDAIKSLGDELDKLKGVEGLVKIFRNLEEVIENANRKAKETPSLLRAIDAYGANVNYDDIISIPDFDDKKLKAQIDHMLAFIEVQLEKGFEELNLDSSDIFDLGDMQRSLKRQIKDISSAIEVFRSAGEDVPQEFMAYLSFLESALPEVHNAFTEAATGAEKFASDLSRIDVEASIFNISNLDVANSKLDATRERLADLRVQAAEYREMLGDGQYIERQGQLNVALNATTTEINKLTDAEAALLAQRNKLEAISQRETVVLALQTQELQQQIGILTGDLGGMGYELEGLASETEILANALEEAKERIAELRRNGEPVPQSWLDNVASYTDKIRENNKELREHARLEEIIRGGREAEREMEQAALAHQESINALMRDRKRAIDDLNRQVLIDEADPRVDTTSDDYRQDIANARADIERDFAADAHALWQRLPPEFKDKAGELFAIFWQAFQDRAAEVKETDSEAGETALEKWMENFEQIKEIAQQTTEIISQLWSNAHQRRLNEINAEKQAITERYAAELDNERLTDAMRKTIEKRREKDMKKIAEKERELRAKQARQQKAQAIFGAIINTSEAVTKALSQGGFIAGIPMSTIIAALGAAQVATIAAAPIPSFEEGVTNFGGGIARVHQDEMLVNLPARTNVITNENVERLAALNTSPIAPSGNDEAANEIRLEQLNRTEALLEAVVEQTERLEQARAYLDIREADELLTRFRYEEGR